MPKCRGGARRARPFSIRTYGFLHLLTINELEYGYRIKNTTKTLKTILICSTLLSASVTFADGGYFCANSVTITHTATTDYFNLNGLGVSLQAPVSSDETINIVIQGIPVVFNYQANDPHSTTYPMEEADVHAKNDIVPPIKQISIDTYNTAGHGYTQCDYREKNGGSYARYWIKPNYPISLEADNFASTWAVLNGDNKWYYCLGTDCNFMVHAKA